MAIKGIGETFTISKGDVSAVVDSHGAKVLSILVAGREILFYDENDIGHSGIPLCFPVFGPLNNGAFLFDGTSYPMNQHGFIRDSIFDIDSDDSSLTCVFCASEESKKRYPFDFEFTVFYKIVENGLSIRFILENNSECELPLAPGVHPYFAVKDSTAITLTSGAQRGNDNSAGYAETSVEESGVFSVVESLSNGLRELKVIGSPDIHLIDHKLDTTLISTGHDQGIAMTADSAIFDRMTVWRKNETVPYICVEPACAQNAINADPIIIPAGKSFDTTVIIALNR